MDYQNRALTLRRGMLPVTYGDVTFRPGDPIPCDHPCVVELRGKLVLFAAPDAVKPKRKDRVKPDPQPESSEESGE